MPDRKGANKPCPMQMRTAIEHTAGTYSYDHYEEVKNRSNNNKERKDQKVGVGMKAWLDPNHALKGSATGDPQKVFKRHVRRTFPRDSMVRGHLLNHDLGGYGVEENLFPITGKANSLHLHKVEYGVKRALETARENKQGVYYQVSVAGDRSDEKDRPVSVFRCLARTLTDVENKSSYGDQLLKVDVVSTPDKDRKAGVASSEKGQAYDDDKKEPESFKHTRGLGSWHHGSRKGKRDFDSELKSGRIRSTDAPTSGDSKTKDTLMENGDDSMAKALLKGAEFFSIRLQINEEGTSWEPILGAVEAAVEDMQDLSLEEVVELFEDSLPILYLLYWERERDLFVDIIRSQL